MFFPWTLHTEGSRPGGTEENYENLSQDSRFPVPDLSPEPPEYETGVLTTGTRRSATFRAATDSYFPNFSPSIT
jgi:hypothetical protein